MHRGPNCERRPADVIGAAGEEPEDHGPSPESKTKTRLRLRSGARAGRQGQKG